VLPRLSRQDIVQIALAILGAFIPLVVFYFLVIWLRAIGPAVGARAPAGQGLGRDSPGLNLRSGSKSSIRVSTCKGQRHTPACHSDAPFRRLKNSCHRFYDLEQIRVEGPLASAPLLIKPHVKQIPRPVVV
jgi:hypothetical protein